MYPDQSHSLPHVRQHQYMAMEDFFNESFDLNSRNPSIEEDTYFDIDSVLYGHNKNQHIAVNKRQKRETLIAKNRRTPHIDRKRA